MSNPSIDNERSPRQDIMTLLSKHIGLNTESVGHTAINRAITKAMKLSRIETEVAYLKQLQRSKDTFRQLIECVVVPETHFFRNPEAFTYLLKYIRQNHQNKEHYKPLRVLSLPCSSGEEVYSIAMTLLEAGLETAHFQVDGIDINQQSLSIARQGIYGAYSFRNSSTFSYKHYVNKYFNPVKEEIYSVQSKIRSGVKFYQGNILDLDGLQQQTSYDIIFCRNLLIYFHDDARKQALSNLYRLLTSDGLIFVGYAETRQLDSQKFRPLAVPQTFAFQKLSEKGSDQKLILSSPQQSLRALNGKGGWSNSRLCQIQQGNPSLRPKDTLEHPERLHPPTPSTSKDVKNKKCIQSQNSETIWLEDLTYIRKLADSGDLETAFKQCNSYLKANPMSSEGYLLMGEVYQAQGNDKQADMAFQRSLYLNPSCVKALNHRLLLCEQNVDQDTAERIRQRIIRLTSDQ